MVQEPNPNQGFPASFIYDKSTKPHFLLHTLPTFSGALQASKRLLGISQTNLSASNIDADPNALPMPAETLPFEAFTATFAVSKDPILQEHTRGERDQNVGSFRALGSPFDEISKHDEASDIGSMMRIIHQGELALLRGWRRWMTRLSSTTSCNSFFYRGRGRGLGSKV